MRLRRLIFGLGFLVLIGCTGLFAQYAGFYVLDGYGGVHAGGGAAAITPTTTYFGWDIAKDFAYIPVSYNDSINGSGFLVLDGYGGIHRGGKLASISVTPTYYFGWNIARAIAYRTIDPHTYGVSSASYVDVTSSSFASIQGPINMVLPDAGYVVVTGVCSINDPQGANNDIVAEIGIGVNSTTSADTSSIRYCTLKGADTVGGWYPATALTVRELFYFAGAGTQRFYLLVRRAGYTGTGVVRVYKFSLDAAYFNKRWDRYSQDPGVPSDEDLALAPNDTPSGDAPARSK